MAAEHTPAGTCELSRLRAPNPQSEDSGVPQPVGNLESRQLNTLQTVVSRHHPHDVLFSVVLLVCMFQQKEINDQASRQISIGKLHVSRRVHIRPINLVIFQVPLGGLCPGTSHLVEGFTLRCFQRFSRPHVATEHCRWHDNSYTRGAFNPVLSY